MPKQTNKQLPPGWAIRKTWLGEKELFSAYATTRSFPSDFSKIAWNQAWARYNTYSRRLKTPNGNTDNGQQTPAEEFGSITKTLHRQRIAMDMNAYYTQTGTPPTLALLDSTSLEGSLAICKEMESRGLPTTNKISAVNNCTFNAHADKIDIFKGKVEDFLSASADDSFSHIWLDLTEIEPDAQMLWNANRVATANVYITVNLRCRVYEDSMLVLKAMCTQMGLHITHSEHYCGLQNTRRTMLFVSCVVKPISTQMRGEYNTAFNAIGTIGWVERRAAIGKAHSKSASREWMVYQRKNKRYDAFVGFVQRYDPLQCTYCIAPFARTGVLTMNTVDVPASSIQKTSIFSKRELRHRQLWK